jgi:hypothetical protein
MRGCVLRFDISGGGALPLDERRALPTLPESERGSNLALRSRIGVVDTRSSVGLE